MKNFESTSAPTSIENEMEELSQIFNKQDNFLKAFMSLALGMYVVLLTFL